MTKTEDPGSTTMTVDAARELGGCVEQLGKDFERVSKTTSIEDDDLPYFVGLESAVDHEIKALFSIVGHLLLIYN
jgi:hypothetical protein